MEFSYDFSNGKAQIIYRLKTTREINKRILYIIQNNQKNFLPIEVKKERTGYSFFFNIKGTTNLKAWLGEASQEKQIKMKDRVQMSLTNILSLYAGKISEEQLIIEEKYLYVDDKTGEIRFICLPVFPEIQALSQNKIDIPPVQKPFLSSSIPKEKDGLEQPLPDIPPAPKSDMILDEFIFKKNKNIKKKEKNVDGKLGFDQWEMPDLQSSYEELIQEENKPLYEVIEPAGEDVKKEQDSHYEEMLPSVEENSENISDEDETTLLKHWDENEDATILLSEWKQPEAYLIREQTGEKFTIGVKECTIGKKESSVDICIKYNPTISRVHCMINYREGVYYIEDCNSKNYTYLNGKRLNPGEPEKMDDQCKIKLSDEEFLFTMDNGI